LRPSRPGGHARRRTAALRAQALVAFAAAAGLALLAVHGHSVVAGGLALAALVLASSRFRAARMWSLGAKGERRVARRLRRLSRRGWVVRNDVDRGLGNVDHVVVGPVVCSRSRPS
jgi:hypothetical protein